MSSRPDTTFVVESPESQTLTILQHGVETRYNIAQLLAFRNNLEEELEKHSAFQSYFEQTAIELEFKKLEFEENGYAKWWAHARRYAKFVHKAKAEKETLESLKDWVITLFSGECSEEQREAYVDVALKGHLLETLGSQKKLDEFYADSGAAAAREGFKGDMYQFVKNGWTYEKIQTVYRGLCEEAKKLSRFAGTFGERAFKMNEVAGLERAKYGQNVRIANDPARGSQESASPWSSRPAVQPTPSGRIQTARTQVATKPLGLPFERTPDGHINNCSLAVGEDSKNCQICNGFCPDQAKFNQQQTSPVSQPVKKRQHNMPKDG
jgi:hypothetical protein